MRSHTVPKRLLETFAYEEPITKSKRLWRYEKGKTPYGRAAPRSATAHEGFFADPMFPDKEAEIEAQLKLFEDPVNEFLELLKYQTYVPTLGHKMALTDYIRMLFTRSPQRRDASALFLQGRIAALKALHNDEEKVVQMAEYSTHALGKPVTVEDIQSGLQVNVDELSSDISAQRAYLQAVETMMGFSEESMRSGEWRIKHVDPADPFVIGDSPVVTWVRLEDNQLNLGEGFTKPNVEVLLPVSPTACLHVLPKVPRTRPTIAPTTSEINKAQAAFAKQHCFANVQSQSLDQELQPEFGKIQLGKVGFSLAHIDDKELIFAIFMGKHPCAS